MKVIFSIIFGMISLLNLNAQNIDMEVKTTENEWVNLQDLKGEKVTVLDFWATWCKPCLNAMPKINDLYNALKDKGVNVIGVSVDSPRNHAKVKPLIYSLGINYPVVFDMDEDLKTELNVVALPTLCVLNEKGKLVYVHEGFTPGDEVKIKDEIEKLL